jgi:transmembrane protein 70, mitochondrial
MSFLVKEKGSNRKPRPLFVDPRLFPDPNHYIKIMGYDKPIDFKLSMPEDAAKK